MNAQQIAQEQLERFTYSELAQLCYVLGVSWGDLGRKGVRTVRTKETMQRGIRRKVENNFPDRVERFARVASDLLEEKGGK